VLLSLVGGRGGKGGAAECILPDVNFPKVSVKKHAASVSG